MSMASAAAAGRLTLFCIASRRGTTSSAGCNRATVTRVRNSFLRASTTRNSCADVVLSNHSIIHTWQRKVIEQPAPSLVRDRVGQCRIPYWGRCKGDAFDPALFDQIWGQIVKQPKGTQLCHCTAQ